MLLSRNTRLQQFELSLFGGLLPPLSLFKMVPHPKSSNRRRNPGLQLLQVYLLQGISGASNPDVIVRVFASHCLLHPDHISTYQTRSRAKQKE